ECWRRKFASRSWELSGRGTCWFRRVSRPVYIMPAKLPMNKRGLKTLTALLSLALPLGASLSFGAAAETTDVAVQELRCEYLSDPLGIDVQKPRLSWVLTQ